MGQNPGAGPQYSPDGKWWWDGQRWVAVVTPNPVPPPPRQPPMLLMAVGAAVVVGAILAVGVAVLPHSQSPAGPSSSQAATTAAPDTPTGTPPQQVDVTSYLKVAQADSAAAASGFGAVSQECMTGEPANCRNALAALDNNLAVFQQDLDAHPAPTCLQQADQQLRLGIETARHGAQTGVQGIDESDGAKITAGGSLIDQANQQFQQAAVLLRTATC